MKSKTVVLLIAIISIWTLFGACVTKKEKPSMSDKSESIVINSTISKITECSETSHLPSSSVDSTTNSKGTSEIELDEYKLIENEIEMNGLRIRFPQIYNMKVTPLMLEKNPEVAENYIGNEDFFNPIILDFACNYWERMEDCTGLTVHYDITYAGWESISIVFTLSDDMGNVCEKHTLEMDLHYRRYNYNWRGDEEATDFYTENLWGATNRFTIITDNITAEEISEFLRKEYAEFSVFREHFQNAGNVEFETSHTRFWLYWSEDYEDKILLFPIRNEKIDYVEILLPIGG